MVVSGLFPQFVLHLEVLVLQLQQNRLVGRNDALQPAHLSQQTPYLHASDLALAFRTDRVSDWRGRLVVDFFSVGGAVVLDMSLLAGAFGMVNFIDFLLLFDGEAALSLAELIGVVVEMGVGVGVS